MNLAEWSPWVKKSYHEYFMKHHLIKTVKIVGPEKAHSFKEILLIRNTVAERTDEMSSDLK